MTRYTMPARSQSNLYAQRVVARLAEKDVHRWVFAYNMNPDVETLVRKWLTIRLDGFYCDVQVMHMPHIVGPELARTHIVLNNTPPLSSMARNDEARMVDARDMNALDTVKALIKATGLNPHMFVCGWPFCLADVDGADDAEGGATLPGRTIEPAAHMRSERKTEDEMTATYIALEGPDGVGKSTVAAALKELLLRRTPTPYPTVRIRHFPTDMMIACANNGGYCRKAEDYARDMENWLSFRPEPVLFSDTPTPAAASSAGPETLYILDRWALSTAVYASLRGEPIEENVALTLNWLNRVPLTTFVLMPRDPEALTDSDYPGPDPYNPRKVTEAYRTFLTNAFVAGEMSRFIPIVVDRARDTPDSVAAEVAEWVAGLQDKM